MKASKRIFSTLLFIIIAVFSSYSQPVVQKLFPKAFVPVLMYHEAGVPRFYANYFRESHGLSELICLRGSIIPFYHSNFYYNDSIQKEVVNISLINRSIHNRFNSVRIDMGYFNSSQVSPLSLPVIFKKGPEKKLLNDYKALSPQVIDLSRRLTENEGVNRYNDIVSKRDYAYGSLLRSVYYDNPELVNVHVDILPDPPKIKERIASDRKAARESMAEMFKRESPSLPSKLNKVDVIKKPWTFSGSENIQFSQAYLKNWVKGGQSSVALLSNMKIKAVYAKDKVQWENSGNHKLGFISSKGSVSRINNDLLDLSSKYGVSASKNWYYSLLFNFKTQFFYGYSSSDTEKETPISGFMSPGYFTLAAGMDYKKGKNFTLLISPVTAKMTVVCDTAHIDQTNYNIEEDKKTLFLTGASLTNNFTWQIDKQIKLTSAANIFYDYFEKEDKIQAEWDMTLDMKVNVFLSTQINTNFRYYETESHSMQMKESMSIAFTYNF